MGRTGNLNNWVALTQLNPTEPIVYNDTPSACFNVSGAKRESFCLLKTQEVVWTMLSSAVFFLSQVLFTIYEAFLDYKLGIMKKAVTLT